MRKIIILKYLFLICIYKTLKFSFYHCHYIYDYS